MFCTNCGKKIPDGTPGAICPECAAAKAAEAASKAAETAAKTAPKAAAAAAPKTAAQMVGSAAKGSFMTAFKTGLKTKAVAVTAGVLATCTVAGFGANAVFGETKEEKILGGFADVVMVEDQYTLPNLALDMAKEFSAFGKEGGSTLSLEATVPNMGLAELELGLKRNGQKTGLSLEADLFGVDVEPSTLYFDSKQAAFTLLGADKSFSVKFQDLVDSAIASELMTKAEAETIRDSLVTALTEGQQTAEDLQRAILDCLEEAMPKKVAEKEGKVEWSGDKYTAYTLRADNTVALQFIQDLGDAALANKDLRAWIDDAIEVAKQEGELDEGFDLNTAWAEAKLNMKDLTVFNSLKLTAYFDGKTCVGLEGKIANLGNNRQDVTFKASHLEEEGDIFKRELELLFVDSGNREYGIRYKGSWTGNALGCTEDGKLTVMNGYGSQVWPVKMNHTVEGDTRTDSLTVMGFTIKHVGEGDPEGKEYKASLSAGILNYEFKIELGYDKGDKKVSAPKSTVLTNGTKEFFDEEALKELQTVVYDLGRLASRLEDKFGGSIG